MIPLTIWPSLYAVDQGREVCFTDAELEAWFANPADVEGPRLAAARFRGPRCNDNVTALTACMLDFDKPIDSVGLFADMLAEAFPETRAHYHSTRSSTEGAWRFHVLLLLSRHITTNKHRLVFRALTRRAMTSGLVADQQGKAPSQCYAVPVASKVYRFGALAGDPVDVDAVLEIERTHATELEAQLRARSSRPIGAKYIERAIANEVHEVRTAGTGTRNATLNRACWSLSRSELGLSTNEIVASLLPPALDCGLTRAEAMAVFRSTLRRRTG